MNDRPTYEELERRLKELENEVLELKRTGASAPEDETDFRNLIEDANDAILIGAGAGVHVYANKTAAEMTGYSISELLQMGIDDLAHPDEVQHIQEKYRKRLAGKMSRAPYETVIVRKDGTSMPVELTGAKTIWASQEADIVILRDIRKRKQIYEQIQKLHRAVEQSIDGIAMGDLEPKLTYVNGAFARMHGYSPQEMIGMKVVNLHNEEQMDEYIRGMYQIKTQGSWVGEIDHIRKDGTPFPTYMSVTLLKDDRGTPRSMLAVARDISEQKKIEGMLRESEEKYRALIQMSNDAIIVGKGDSMEFNESSLRLFGCSSHEQILGKTPFDFSPSNQPDGSDSREKAMQLVEMTIAGEPQRFYWRHQKLDGTPIETEVSLSPIKIKGEAIILETIRDITEYKEVQEKFIKARVGLEATVKKRTAELAKANQRMKEELEDRRRVEKELRENRDLLQAIIDNTGAAIYVKDCDGRYMLINKYAQNLLKMEKEHIIGKTDHDLLPKEIAVNFVDNDKKVLESGSPLKFEETRRFTGEERSYISVKFPLFDSAGHVFAVCGISTDITMLKKTETKLRESERKLQALFDASAEPVLLIDTRGTILASNRTFARYYNSSQDELLGLNVFSLMPPSVANYRKEQANKVILSGKPVRFEDERNERIFDNSIYPVFDTKGNVKALAVYSYNITKARQVESELRASKQKYCKLFENVPVGVGLSSLDGHLVECNEAMCRITGYKPEDFLEITAGDMYENSETRMEILKRLQRHGLVRDYEARMRRKDGTIYFANLTMAAFELSDRQMLLTVNEDITYRKASEEILRKSNSELEAQVSQRTGELETSNKRLESEVKRRMRVEKDLRTLNKKLQRLNKNLSEEILERKALSRRLIDLLEQERQKISMELHDQLGQSLTGLKMSLEMIVRKLGPTQFDLKNHLASVVDVAGDIIREVKSICFGLRPSMLDSLGLIPSIRGLVTDYEGRSGFKIHFFQKNLTEDLEAEKKLALYRICQEGLTNVAKHAEASTVFLSLVKEDSFIKLSIEDDGIGFDPGQLRAVSPGPGTLGLAIMSERVRQLGGEFFVESRTGEKSGTHVMAEMPL